MINGFSHLPFSQKKPSTIDVRLDSKYASDKDNKYTVNFKLTQICLHNDFLLPKEENILNLIPSLALFFAILQRVWEGQHFQPK